jgi:hypothetical protein
LENLQPMGTYSWASDVRDRKVTWADVQPTGCSFFHPRQSRDDPAKRDNFKMRWAFGPVVTPTNDDIATLWRMCIIAKVTALLFELNAHPLPLAGLNLPLCLVVGEPCLNCLHEVPKLTGDHALAGQPLA